MNGSIIIMPPKLENKAKKFLWDALKFNAKNLNKAVVIESYIDL